MSRVFRRRLDDGTIDSEAVLTDGSVTVYQRAWGQRHLEEISRRPILRPTQLSRYLTALHDQGYREEETG